MMRGYHQLSNQRTLVVAHLTREILCPHTISSDFCGTPILLLKKKGTPKIRVIEKNAFITATCYLSEAIIVVTIGGYAVFTYASSAL